MVRDRLKQRLTGAIALILTGVVAWFWLLDSGDGGFQVAEETVIPPAPAIAPFPVAEPRIPADLADTPAPEFDHAGNDEQPVAEQVAPAAPAPQSRPSTPTPAATPTPAPAAKTPAQSAPEQRYAVDRDGAPQGWVVQVASLASDANAERLVKELQAAGFKSFSRPGQTDGKTIQRVFAGPWLSREQANNQQQVIAERFGVKPIVVQFEP